MPDLSQDVFDQAEEIANALHYLEGCEDALRLALDGRIADEGTHGKAIYSVLEAMGGFRTSARMGTDALIRLMSQSG